MFDQAADPSAPAFGFSPAADASAPPPLPVSAMYDLRPLSTGEILDRTFALYRRRFWLYAGISSVASALAVLTNLAQMTWMAHMPAAQGTLAKPVGAPAVDFKAVGVGLAFTYGLLLIHFLIASLTQAATVSAVSTVYLGHQSSIKTAFRVTIGKWYKWAAIALWQIWSAVWIFTLLLIPAAVLIAMKLTSLVVVGWLLLTVAFLSLIYGVMAYLRNSLAIPASVFERLAIRKSMRRSKALAAGIKGRLFLLSVMLIILSFVAGMLQMPFALLMMPTGHFGHKLMLQGGSLIMLFITNTLVAPVGAIAFCLFYFDARVRKEGFDIEALMDPTLGLAARPSAAPAGLLPSGFAPSGFTAEVAPAPPPVAVFPLAGSPFAPSEFTAQPPALPSSPFAPSEFTAPAEESGEPR